MPVFLYSGSGKYRPFIKDGYRRETTSNDSGWADADGIDVGLINNMSDAALETTERQVLKLLDAAAKDLVIRLRLYSLPEFPRSDLGQRHLQRFHYLGVDDLLDAKIDGLIVTGAEPRASDLTHEPYWPGLIEVFRWAEEATLSMISSCLAVHAAVLHMDGIGRYPLDTKCFGVFEFDKVLDHPIVTGVPSRLRTPHSRWNEVRRSDLLSCGYNVLSSSQERGVDIFVKQRRSLLVFFQGHPEYEAWTLLGEYRRDIERFLRGERDKYPDIPLEYFDIQTMEEVRQLRERALADRRVEVLATFSIAAVGQTLTDPWRSTAVQVYRNWLLYLSAQRLSRSKRVSLAARP